MSGKCSKCGSERSALVTVLSNDGLIIATCPDCHSTFLADINSWIVRGVCYANRYGG